MAAQRVPASPFETLPCGLLLRVRAPGHFIIIQGFHLRADFFAVSTVITTRLFGPNELRVSGLISAAASAS